MGYAYEDEDVENIDVEEEVTPKLKKKEKGNDEYTIDNLLASENEPISPAAYTVDNLLDSEEETSMYLGDLLSKKDTKLFDAYLGANAKKITDNRFNFAAFFFGGAYLIYRKVYLIGAIWMILCLAVQVLFPIALVKWYITSLFLLAASITCGLIANQLILNSAASKILNLKVNKEKNIKEKLMSVGGTNLVLFIVAMLLSSFVLFVSYYVPFEKALKKLEYETKYIQYDGRINANQDVVISNYIDIEVPEGYRDAYLDPYRYSYLYMEDLNIAIDLMQVDLYESSKSLIEGIAIYENMSEDDVKMMTINNTRWYYVESTLSFYASGILDGKMYIFKHTHNGNKDAKFDYEEFIGSIKTK